MDSSVDSFHVHHLKDCKSFSCPVCYLIKNPEFLEHSVCMACGTNDLLWFCLTCGHVGCGHEIKRHALEHYTETKHRYVVDLQGFKVFDHEKLEWLHVDFNGDEEKKLEIFSKHIGMKFVNKCLCAVCKYKRTPRLPKQYSCMKCEICQPQDLWICVYCNHVGCSRYKNWHALQHFRTTNHPIVMQLQNLSTWDYSKQTYQHIELHETESMKSADAEYANVNCKTEIDDGFKEEYLHENDSSTSIEVIGSAGEFATANILPKEELSTAAELLQQQQEDLLNRLDRLERQWQEFGKLTEANRKMITIEKRLLDLTNEKKILEEKLCEHDAKLNELILQISENALTSKNFEKGELDDVEHQRKNRIFISDVSGIPTSSVNSTNFNQNELLAILIVGLIAFFIFRFAVGKVLEIFRNLF